MNLEQASCPEQNLPDLDRLLIGELEQILINMLVVKYPGIEQCDVDYLLAAIETGNIDRIEQVEADMAQKSARWMTAALEVDRQWTMRNTPASF